MSHRKLALLAALTALAGGKESYCCASDPRCDSPAKCAAFGESRDSWSQISGPNYGYFPTRWRAMPEVSVLPADVLPIPVDTTRKVPTISVEGAAPAEAPRPKTPDVPKVPQAGPSSGRFGEQR
jgi:hypothetical protein